MSVVPESAPLRNPGRAAALLAFNAGFIDTVGFVGLFGLFTAHVTGNFVLIGASIVTHGSGIVAKLLALPTFILAVAVTSLLLRRGRNNRRLAIGYLLFFQIVLLMAFMAVGVLGGPFKGGDQPIAVACGLVGVVAMGLQNAGSRTLFAQLSPTTVMTGNVTQLVIDLVDLLRGAADAPLRQRIHKFLWPILAFAAGAICGAFAFLHAALWALALPLVVLAGLAVSSVADEVRSQASVSRA